MSVRNRAHWDRHIDQVIRSLHYTRLGEGLAGEKPYAALSEMLADIEMDALVAAVESLRAFAPDVRGVACDVTDPSSVERAAQASYAAFGHVHVVCNNAGVAGGSGIDDISLETWRWVLDVNLMGVLHGIHTFLPHILAHGEGGHIVNTASMAGMNSGLGFSPYSASKFAVVNMSEGLAMQLKPLGIGVTVLCPGPVPSEFQARAGFRPGFDSAVLKVLPADVAQQAYRGLMANKRAVMPGLGIKIVPFLLRLFPRSFILGAVGRLQLRQR